MMAWLIALAAWAPPLALRSSTCRVVGRAVAVPVALGSLGRDEEHVVRDIFEGPLSQFWLASLQISGGLQQRKPTSMMELDCETLDLAEELAREFMEAVRLTLTMTIWLAIDALIWATLCNRSLGCSLVTPVVGRKRSLRGNG
eukprot:scaffold6865_cov97-Isochrysis_galbana.AAC.3